MESEQYFKKNYVHEIIFKDLPKIFDILVILVHIYVNFS